MSRWIDFENFPSTATPLSAENLNGLQDMIQAAIAESWKIIYPVGSIYISTNPNSPETLFGGRWEAYGAGEVLVGYKSTDTDFATIGNEGGYKEWTLTKDQMPSHNHGNSGGNTTASGGGHNHTAKFKEQVKSNGSGTSRDFARKYSSTDQDSTANMFSGSDGKHTHTLVAQGGNQAHPNMPPYIVVYMWRRLPDNA